MGLRVSHEQERGCGFRKTGALYLVAGAEGGWPCGKMPLAIGRCPACGEGITPSRGIKSIEPAKLFQPGLCPEESCLSCPAGGATPEKALLIWIGERFYPDPRDFLREAATQGISRRITAVPKGFVVGETWVFLAHRKACSQTMPCPRCDGHGTINVGEERCPKCEGDRVVVTQTPGLFMVFKPSAIEMVVNSTDLPDAEELERLAKRGIEPVIVKPAQITIADASNQTLH